MHDIFKAMADMKDSLIREANQTADQAQYLSYAVAGIATCLLASLKKDDLKHSDKLIETVSPALYARAKELVTLELYPDLEGDGSGRPVDKTALSPERAWPLMLCMAVYEKFGVDGNGFMEGYDGHILESEDDGFPMHLREKQLDIAQSIIVELYEFSETATDMLRSHLNYPCEMNPLWFYSVIQIAGENGIEYSENLKDWFFDCFDVLLVDVHEARKNNPDQSYKSHYH